MNKKHQIVKDEIPPTPKPKRGEIWLVKFLKTKENRKPNRPCLVISNDIQNEFDDWIIVAGMTKDIGNVQIFEVFVENTPETGLDYPSKILFNYPRTIDKSRLKKFLGVASEKTMEKSKTAWKRALDWE